MTLRRVLWLAGSPVRLALLGFVRAYRALPPILGGRCRFHPSCSAYAEQALRRHGAIKGSILGVWRVLRCSPLTAGGPDPVPPRGAWRAPSYDAVIQEDD